MAQVIARTSGRNRQHNRNILPENDDVDGEADNDDDADVDDDDPLSSSAGLLLTAWRPPFQ